MSIWINRVKRFLAVYGIGRYGVSKYGDGVAGAGFITNKQKS